MEVRNESSSGTYLGEEHAAKAIAVQQRPKVRKYLVQLAYGVPSVAGAEMMMGKV